MNWDEATVPVMPDAGTYDNYAAQWGRVMRVKAIRLFTLLCPCPRATCKCVVCLPQPEYRKDEDE